MKLSITISVVLTLVFLCTNSVSPQRRSTGATKKQATANSGANAVKSAKRQVTVQLKNGDSVQGTFVTASAVGVRITVGSSTLTINWADLNQLVFADGDTVDDPTKSNAIGPNISEPTPRQGDESASVDSTPYTPPNIHGRWSVTLNIAGKSTPMIFSFTKFGRVYVGSITHDLGSSAVTNTLQKVLVRGRYFSFSIIDKVNNKVTLLCSGNIDGDSMNGTVRAVFDAGQEVDGTFSGTRIG
jgi:hypothetical protein